MALNNQVRTILLTIIKIALGKREPTHELDQ